MFVGEEKKKKGKVKYNFFKILDKLSKIGNSLIPPPTST